jgi:hypothetical protein
VGESGGDQMKKGIFIILAIGLVFNISIAMAETGNAGYAGDFLRFGLGARPLGMGGAFAAIAEGCEAAYYNPAGLGFSTGHEVGFVYQSLTLDRKIGSVAAVIPVRNEAVIGVSWLYSSVGNVPIRDSDRNYLGDMANNNNSFGLSFSKKPIDQLSVGATLHYLQSKNQSMSAFTIGVDMGGLYNYQDIAAVGLCVSNLGSSYNWDDWAGQGKKYKDKFPVQVRAGVAGFLFDKKLVADCDIIKDEKLNLKFHAGAEYWLTKKVSVPSEGDEEGENEGPRTVVADKRFFGARIGYSEGSFTFGGSLILPISPVTGGFDYAYMTGKRDEGAYSILALRIMF